MTFFDIWKLERKKNEEIKGRISRRSLVLFHITQQMIHNICTKLQNHRCNSSWEISDTNFSMYYIGVRDREKGKRRQNKSQQFCFLSYNILGHSQCVYKIWRLAEAEKFEPENLLRKKNGQIKVITRATCWFSFTQYNRSYPTFVPNLKILGTVVPEKSLIQISLCLTFVCQMEKNGKRRQKFITASWFSFS